MEGIATNFTNTMGNSVEIVILTLVLISLCVLWNGFNFFVCSFVGFFLSFFVGVHLCVFSMKWILCLLYHDFFFLCWFLCVLNEMDLTCVCSIVGFFFLSLLALMPCVLMKWILCLLYRVFLFLCWFFVCVMKWI